MFLTIVLACSISILTECRIFEDAYGPYLTREECVERAEVMRESIIEISEGDMEECSIAAMMRSNQMEFRHDLGRCNRCSC